MTYQRSCQASSRRTGEIKRTILYRCKFEESRAGVRTMPMAGEESAIMLCRRVGWVIACATSEVMRGGVRGGDRACCEDGSGLINTKYMLKKTPTWEFAKNNHTNRQGNQRPNKETRTIQQISNKQIREQQITHKRTEKTRKKNTRNNSNLNINISTTFTKSRHRHQHCKHCSRQVQYQRINHSWHDNGDKTYYNKLQ